MNAHWGHVCSQSLNCPSRWDWSKEQIICHWHVESCGLHHVIDVLSFWPIMCSLLYLWCWICHSTVTKPWTIPVWPWMAPHWSSHGPVWSTSGVWAAVRRRWKSSNFLHLTPFFSLMENLHGQFPTCFSHFDSFFNQLIDAEPGGLASLLWSY